jgi:excisionase family DNA binding protein
MVRLSELFGVESPRTLRTAIAAHFGTGPKVLQSALGLADSDWSLLKGPWLQYCEEVDTLPSGLVRADFSLVVMRWCPSCLRDSMHLRWPWSIKLICWCDRHHVVLRDACPRCSAVQRLARPRLSICSCGYDLTRAPTSAGNGALVDVQDRLIGKLLCGASDPVLDLPVDGWLKLLRIADQIVDAQRARKTGQVSGLDRVDVSARQSTALGQLLHDWPRGFHTVLDTHRDSRQGSFSISKSYGRIYKWLYVYLADPCFHFLRDAFEAYLNEHWWGLVCRRNRNLSNRTQAAHGRQTVAASARAAGTAPSVVRQLHLAGLVDAHVVQLPSGRTAWSVPTSEVDVIARYVEDGVNLQTAARSLGVAESRVRELIDGGLLTAHFRSKGGARPWLLVRSEIDGVMARCLAQLPTKSLDSGHGVGLHQLLKSWRLQKGEFPELLRAIQSGAVPVVGVAAGLAGIGGLVLMRDAAAAWRQAREQNAREWLSVDAAAQLLGVKQQVGYQLVRAGLLHSTEVSKGRSGRRIHRDAVHRFKAEYVSLSEVASAMKRSPKTLLSELPVRPACGPSVDGARQYFFLRRELANSGLDIPVAES